MQKTDPAGEAVVHTRVVDQTLVITFDRPKANAIDIASSQALYKAFKRLEDDSSLRVGILTGGGDRFFSAGWDLKAGEELDSDYGPGGFGGLTEYFERTKPVIAAVNGLALGGGFEVALAADLIVAADHAEFALPEVRRGFTPSNGMFLARRLPDVIARELLLTGRRMQATEAARLGLVNRVVPAAGLLDAALDIARQICLGGPLAVAAIQEVLLATAHLSIPDAYQLLGSGQLPHYEAMLKSEDANEGPRAFGEKRPPRWQGR